MTNTKGISRRRFLIDATKAGATVLGGCGAIALSPHQIWAATEKRSLKFARLTYCLGLHVPGTVGRFEMPVKYYGYGPPVVHKFQKGIEAITMTLAGTTEFAQCDPVLPIRAAETGKDIKVIASGYEWTTLVVTVNSDKIKTWKDFEKPGIRVGIASKGAMQSAYWNTALKKNGVDMKKVMFIEIGGSGSRMRAFLAGKIDASLQHLDQVWKMEKMGPYKFLAYPNEIFDYWNQEILAVSGKWLKKKENERAAVDVIKGVMRAIKKTREDPDWYVEKYRKWATTKLKGVTDDDIKKLYNALKNDLGLWPEDLGYSHEKFDKVRILYQDAGYDKGTVKTEDLFLMEYYDQAREELKKEL